MHGDLAMASRKQPVNLNLFTVHFPITAVVSILHRVSGVVLFLAIPLILYCFEYSVSDEDGFEQLRQFFNSWLFVFILFTILWAILHHMFAGIRFLLLDLDIGVSLRKAQMSAVAVVIASLVLLFFLIYLM